MPILLTVHDTSKITETSSHYRYTHTSYILDACQRFHLETMYEYFLQDISEFHHQRSIQMSILSLYVNSCMRQIQAILSTTSWRHQCCGHIFMLRSYWLTHYYAYACLLMHAAVHYNNQTQNDPAEKRLNLTKVYHNLQSDTKRSDSILSARHDAVSHRTSLCVPLCSVCWTSHGNVVWWSACVATSVGGKGAHWSSSLIGIFRCS